MWSVSRELRQASDDPQHSGKEGSKPLPHGSEHEEPGRSQGRDQEHGEGEHLEGLGQPKDQQERRDGAGEDAPGPGQ